MNLDARLLSVVALASIICASISGWAVTTINSYSVFSLFRQGFLLLSFALLLIVVVNKRSSQKTALYAATLLILIFISGTLNLILRNLNFQNWQWLVLNFGLTLSILVLLSEAVKLQSSDILARLILGFVLLGFCLTIFYGGIEFMPIPIFQMTYQSQVSGTDYVISYGQGVTKFYGIGAICAAYLTTASEGSFAKVMSFLALGLLLGLSVAGGARGDLLAVCLVLIFHFRQHKIYSSIFVLFLCLVVLYFGRQFNLDSLVIFERFSRIGEASEVRADLIVKSLILLRDRPDCLLFGCGFQYFQDYFRFPDNVYPHNIFIEMIIVMGLPLSSALLTMSLIGLFVMRGSDLDTSLILSLIHI